MKRYYEFLATAENGKKEYFTIDVTNILLIRHDENKWKHGETSIYFNGNQCVFSGQNNKTMYDEIRNIMRQLETTE